MEIGPTAVKIIQYPTEIAPMINAFINTGINHHCDDWLKTKVRLSNVLALILTVIAVVFSIMSAIYFYEATYIPIIAIVICLIVFPLNLISAFTISRFVISTLPVTLTILFSSCLSSYTQSSSPYFWGLAISFMTISFVLFDSREFSLNLSCFGCCVLPLFFFNYLNQALEYAVDSSSVITLFDYLAFTSSIIVVGSALFWLQFEIMRSEKLSSSLLKSLDTKNKQMEKAAAELKQMIVGLEKKEIKDKQQSWITQGVAFIMQNFRSTHASAKLYDGLLKHVVTYAKASQGALFVFNSMDNVLELKSCYAYNRKKFIEKKIAPGEGIVGQCFVERGRIYMIEVPKNYITITSGLGEALPTAICICPLIVNDIVEGVLELAFFGKPDECVLQFCDRGSEAIATILREQREVLRTNELLSESQKLANELKLKEEQMMQSVEELMTVQEEMKRKEKEYLSRIYKLSQGENQASLLRN